MDVSPPPPAPARFRGVVNYEDGGQRGRRDTEVLLGLAFAVGIAAWAPRAFAQSIFSPDPAVLWQDEVNGASITLEAPRTKEFSPIAETDNRFG